MIEKIPHEWRYRDSETGMFYPWYTKPCLEWLITQDLRGKLVFEYGVGDSTKWYISRDAIVYGTDNNEEWFKRTAGIGQQGCMHAVNKEDYLTAIQHWFKNGDWDIVVIDGIHRDECTEYALKALKPGGFLIIDNWMQPSVEMNWDKTVKLIEGMPITIYKEPDHYDWQTAVITKP